MKIFFIADLKLDFYRIWWDMCMENRQATKISNCPQSSHVSAIERTSKCLLGAYEKSLTSKSDVSKGYDVFAEANFAGSFDKLCV